MGNVECSLTYKPKGSKSNILSIHKKGRQISPHQTSPQAPTPPGRVSPFVRPAARPWRYLHQWTPHAVHDGRSRHRPAARALHPAAGETGQRPFPYSARGSRASRAATASRGERRPSMTASTARLMGRSTPSAWARATTAGQQATPSAT